MAEQLTPDICVIGGGAAGLSVAAGAALLGAPAVLIEKGRMGGECLNAGCVPSKALLAAAKHAAAFRDGGAFGITAPAPEIAFDAVNDHVRGTIAKIAPNDSKERFTALGVRVIEGTARFKDRRTVAVGDAFEIRARRFVIATGSLPAVPPIPGFDVTSYLTNDTIFDLRERPRHLIVIGAGPVGLELAQAFRRLGSAVTVLDAGAPLAKEDPECAAVVLDALAREGVTIRSALKIARVQRGGDGVEVVLGGSPEETIGGSHLLVATGRRPNIEDLALDAAGIRHDSGGIAVDRRMRTSNRKVYAIGDVTALPRFTHVANHEASLVVRNALLRWPVRFDANAMPRVTFTDPEIAHVGADERQARAWYRSIRVLRWPYADNDRAQAERSTEGHIKVVTSPTGKVLGATIVGSSAGELIMPWTLAVSRGLNIRVFAGIVVPYPTLGEISRRAAFEFFAPGLASPWLRRWVRLLRRLG